MLPFTAEQVIDAFRRHPEVKPDTGAFVRLDEDQEAIEYCCGLTIMAIDEGKTNEILGIHCGTNSSSNNWCHTIKEMIWDNRPLVDPPTINELNRFTSGFDRGFDDTSPGPAGRVGPAFYEGYKAGQGARALIDERGKK